MEHEHPFLKIDNPDNAPISIIVGINEEEEESSPAQ
jgi:hypothetical protein